MREPLLSILTLPLFSSDKLFVLLLILLGQGSMICGTDNCPYTGGRWDSEDDCCERRCTPDHPCREGEGHCEADADCVNSGWARCGDNLCLNTQYFPTAEYPNNTAWFGHSSSDNCCYRVCNKNYNRCRDKCLRSLTETF